MNTVCFIGFGNMAKALARGLLKQKNYHLAAAAPSLTVGVNAEGIHTYKDNKAALKNAAIIILAIKPMQMSTALKEIGLLLPKDSLLISVATGMSIDWMSAYCRPGQAIVRTMPNTPAAVGCAATPMIANSATSPAHKKQAELIFSSVGLAHWLDNEQDIDRFTALSGSGPAYVFSFMQAMIASGVQLGLASDEVQQFVLQTCKGAVQLAEQSTVDIATLKKQITSPGGTTAAALEVLDSQLNPLVQAAIEAAYRRAKN